MFLWKRKYRRSLRFLGERAHVIDQVPALFVSHSSAKSRHGLVAFRDHPKYFAVGLQTHGMGVSKICRRNGKPLGAFAFAVAIHAVAALAVGAIIDLSAG